MSDHSPVFISLQQKFIAPPKPFKFFNLWIKHPDFLKAVEQSWSEHVSGNSMIILHKKMKKLKVCLRNLNTQNYADISRKVKEKKMELAEVQITNLSNPGENTVEQEKTLIKELHELLVAEESFFKQKFRIRWIQEGNMNTKFFHRVTAARQKHRTIQTLTDSDGK